MWAWPLLRSLLPVRSRPLVHAAVMAPRANVPQTMTAPADGAILPIVGIPATAATQTVTVPPTVRTIPTAAVPPTVAVMAIGVNTGVGTRVGIQAVVGTWTMADILVIIATRDAMTIARAGIVLAAIASNAVWTAIGNSGGRRRADQEIAFAVLFFS